MNVTGVDVRMLIRRLYCNFLPSRELPYSPHTHGTINPLAANSSIYESNPYCRRLRVDRGLVWYRRRGIVRWIWPWPWPTHLDMSWWLALDSTGLNGKRRCNVTSDVPYMYLPIRTRPTNFRLRFRFRFRSYLVLFAYGTVQYSTVQYLACLHTTTALRRDRCQRRERCF
jgi:hypothetical protein